MKPFQQSRWRLLVALLVGYVAIDVRTAALTFSTITFGNPLLYFYAERAKPYELQWGQFFSQLNYILFTLPVALIYGAVAARWLRLRDIQAGIAALAGWHLPLLLSAWVTDFERASFVYMSPGFWVYQAGALLGAWFTARQLRSRVV